MNLTLKVPDAIIELRALLIVSVVAFGATLARTLGIPLLTRYYLDYFSDVRAFSFAFAYLIPVFYVLLGPFLLFVAIYLLLSREFPSQTASILTSIILGSVLGRFLAILAASGIFILLGVSAQLSAGSYDVLYSTVIDLLAGFLAFTNRYMMTQWDARISASGILLKSARPANLFLLTALNFVVGILAFALIPILSLLPSLSPISSLSVVPLLTLFGPLVGSIVVLQTVVGYGLLRGLRWAWIIALIVSLSGAVSIADLLLSLSRVLDPLGYPASSPPDTTLINVSLVALVLDFALLALLMRKDSRLYYRIVDPSAREEQPNASEKLVGIS